jgi:hypothetical protein
MTSQHFIYLLGNRCASYTATLLCKVRCQAMIPWPFLGMGSHLVICFGLY